VRCGASNRCWYCARLAAIETAMVLQLDGEQRGHPTIGMTLTTVEHRTTSADLRRGIEQLFRALRRRWPAISYCAFIEWTTGTAKLSGGHRRIHVHLLLKGLPVAATAAAETIARDVWKARTRAHRVEVRELRSAGGATAYLALHHRKRSQGPPAGWSGKRLRSSRGYFGATGNVAQLREHARAMLADRRLYAALVEALDPPDGIPAWMLDELVEEQWEAAKAAVRDERPVLVKTIEREHVDRETGQLTWSIVGERGPVDRQPAREALR
jgi:hypothetical protein